MGGSSSPPKQPGCSFVVLSWGSPRTWEGREGSPNYAKLRTQL